jgi:hypothetical protein
MWIFVGLLMFYVGYKVGRKYTDFHELMFARRLAHQMKQAEKLARGIEELEEAIRTGRPSKVVRRAVLGGKKS